VDVDLSFVMLSPLQGARARERLSAVRARRRDERCSRIDPGVPDA
jgi:hypothetical protein